MILALLYANPAHYDHGDGKQSKVSLKITQNKMQDCILEISIVKAIRGPSTKTGHLSWIAFI